MLIGWVIGPITADTSHNDLEAVASKFAVKDAITKGHCVAVEFAAGDGIAIGVGDSVRFCRGGSGHPYYCRRYAAVHDVELCSNGGTDKHFH